MLQLKLILSRTKISHVSGYIHMKKLTEEEKEAKKLAKKQAKEQRKAEGKTLWQDFKKFISRGNVLDMAVGVIMGSAFSAIVTAFTNILLSVCTWGVPGGLKGLVTVLPAANPAQKGMDVAHGLGQFFKAEELQNLAKGFADATYGADVVAKNPTLIENVKNTILSKYTLHGTTYTYNMSAVIDWGTFINAIISFLIIALTLFVIVKVFNSIHDKRKAFEAQMALKVQQAKEANGKNGEASDKTAEEAK